MKSVHIDGNHELTDTISQDLKSFTLYDKQWLQLFLNGLSNSVLLIQMMLDHYK